MNLHLIGVICFTVFNLTSTKVIFNSTVYMTVNKVEFDLVFTKIETFDVMNCIQQM